MGIKEIISDNVADMLRAQSSKKYSYKIVCYKKGTSLASRYVNLCTTDAPVFAYR